MCVKKSNKAMQHRALRALDNVFADCGVSVHNSLAFPLIGAGSGNRGLNWSLNLMLETFKEIESNVVVKIVRYKASN